jgi:hypothetical protein
MSPTPLANVYLLTDFLTYASRSIAPFWSETSAEAVTASVSFTNRGYLSPSQALCPALITSMIGSSTVPRCWMPRFIHPGMIANEQSKHDRFFFRTPSITSCGRKDRYKLKCRCPLARTVAAVHLWVGPESSLLRSDRLLTPAAIHARGLTEVAWTKCQPEDPAFLVCADSPRESQVQVKATSANGVARRDARIQLSATNVASAYGKSHRDLFPVDHRAVHFVNSLGRFCRR